MTDTLKAAREFFEIQGFGSTVVIHFNDAIDVAAEYAQKVADEQTKELRERLETNEMFLSDIAMMLGTHNPKFIIENIQKLQKECRDWNETASRWETEAIKLQGANNE